MYHYAIKKNGDLIVEINQERLPMDLTKDAFLDMLVSLPRPVCIGFRLQKDRLTQHQDEFNNELSYRYSPIENVGVYVPGVYISHRWQLDPSRCRQQCMHHAAELLGLV